MLKTDWFEKVPPLIYDEADQLPEYKIQIFEPNVFADNVYFGDQTEQWRNFQFRVPEQFDNSNARLVWPNDILKVLMYLTDTQDSIVTEWTLRATVAAWLDFDVNDERFEAAYLATLADLKLNGQLVITGEDVNVIQLTAGFKLLTKQPEIRVYPTGLSDGSIFTLLQTYTLLYGSRGVMLWGYCHADWHYDLTENPDFIPVNTIFQYTGVTQDIIMNYHLDYIQDDYYMRVDRFDGLDYLRLLAAKDGLCFKSLTTGLQVLLTAHDVAAKQTLILQKNQREKLTPKPYNLVVQAVFATFNGQTLRQEFDKYKAVYDQLETEEQLAGLKGEVQRQPETFDTRLDAYQTVLTWLLYNYAQREKDVQPNQVLVDFKQDIDLYLDPAMTIDMQIKDEKDSSVDTEASKLWRQFYGKTFDYADFDITNIDLSTTLSDAIDAYLSLPKVLKASIMDQYLTLIEQRQAVLHDGCDDSIEHYLDDQDDGIDFNVNLDAKGSVIRFEGDNEDKHVPPYDADDLPF